jgi:hypothetical protein
VGKHERGPVVGTAETSRRDPAKSAYEVKAAVRRTSLGDLICPTPDQAPWVITAAPDPYGLRLQLDSQPVELSQ